MKFYSNKNVAFCGGNWRLKLLAVVGGLLGILFHHQGIPFGGKRG